MGHLDVPFGTGKHAPITAENKGRVIAGILANPTRHEGKVYPLYGPTEVTYAGTAEILRRGSGKPVEYKQLEFAGFRHILEDDGRKSAAGNDFLFQHLQDVAIDHQNGIFEGTNDLLEQLGGRRPLSLAAFIMKHRAAFE